MDCKDINFCCYLRTKDSDMVIDIAKVLSQDVISRSRARGLMAYIVERELTDVELDFRDKDLFHKFVESKSVFEKALGADVELRDAEKASRLLVTKSINVKDSSKWLEISNWLFDKAKVFKSIASKIDK